MHDPEKQTKLQTDVSDKVIKTMVFQQKKLLNYYSKKLTLIETNYITGNKKMFAVMVALKHWRHFTQGAKLLRPQSQTKKVRRERLPKFAFGNLGKRSKNVGNV